METTSVALKATKGKQIADAPEAVEALYTAARDAAEPQCKATVQSHEAEPQDCGRERVAVRRRSEEVESDGGVVEKYRSHANGNGWVSSKATVHPSAFVSENAYVEAGAEVGAETWIGAGSWIDHGVVLGERVFVGQNVHVGPDSRVGSSAWVGSHARIGSGVRIAGGVRLERDAVVADASVIGPPPAAHLNATAHRVPPHAAPGSASTNTAPVKRARSRYTRAA